MTRNQPEEPVILMVDDDEDDRLMTARSLRGTALESCIHFAEDGADMLDYLHHRGRFEDMATPTPGLILLDLNMPRMDGRAALRALKSDTLLRTIPVVVMTTSSSDEDITASYALGVNAFVTKPVTFVALCEAMRKIGEFWFDLAERPTVALRRQP